MEKPSRRATTWLKLGRLGTVLVVIIWSCSVIEARGGTILALRQKSNTKNSVMHANFKEAGKKAGLQIWRIQDFEPVPYPISDYGKFYSGDSYIVLNTKENKGTFSWDLHYWLGKETSQDESGSAAILAVQLDDGLGGIPVQYREVQEHESELFSSYFKGGIRYLPGGVASGFRHTEINPNGEKKLYQVKGKKHIRVTQVPAHITSMNNGDCYILDTGKEIYVYCGEKCKRTERLTATTAANQIRDQDHSGRAHVTIIETTSNGEDEIEKFFKELGSGSLKQIAQAPTVDDDEAFEKKQDEKVTLFKVSDASGTLKVDKIGQKPLAKSSLVSDDCFILDTVTSLDGVTSPVIYVWIGKKGTATEKTEAMKIAQKFIKENKYPDWIQVTRVVEGGEPSVFKQYFDKW